MDHKGLPVPDDIDMETDRESYVEDRRSFLPPKRPKKHRLLKAVALVGLLALLIGGGAFGYLKYVHKKVSPTPVVATTQKPAAPAVADTTTALSQYVSPAGSFNLSFNYPTNWTVTPSTGMVSKTITVTSPAVSIPSAAGTAANGKIVVQIRQSGTTIGELSASPATEAIDATQYAYTAPTKAQHQYFYVSFLHFPTGGTVAGSFEETVITGISQMLKGTAVSSDSLSQVDPLITASFYKCQTTTCSGTAATPLSVTTSAWDNNVSLQQVATLFESLKFN